MAQFEAGKLVFFDEADAEDIGGGKEPAAARGALVGDGRAFEGDFMGEEVDVVLEGGGVDEDGGCRVGGEGSEGEAVLRSRLAVIRWETVGKVPWGQLVGGLPTSVLPRGRAPGRARRRKG